jgi:deoxycytidylate deaminase
MSVSCGDCGCKTGELHEIFCTKERCPFCGAQLVSCGCISKVLNLTSVEQDAVDEYIDDEEEPLKSINARWVKALNAKGRVPF